VGHELRGREREEMRMKETMKKERKEDGLILNDAVTNNF